MANKTGNKSFWNDPVKSASARRKLSLMRKGELNPAKRPEVAAKISKALKGRKAWNKGKGKGYCFHKDRKMIKASTHHRAWSNGYVYEHVLILEKKIGRQMKRGEVCHHIDGDITNNHPTNLALLTVHSHSREEWKRPEFKQEQKSRMKKVCSSLKYRKSQSDTMKSVRKEKFWSTRKKN